MTKTYVTVIDSKGATLGKDGPFVSISHRFLYENRAFYGTDSLRRLFPFGDLLDACQTMVETPSGTMGTLTWTHT